ncbi:retron St85 family RNA-directed DNA polymerase [Clostridium beijerinckii]|uniref:retron St85 family RNA-directed DNA polymerase n=1 Tax=Clostridium beijerinckii TaxID=1520 RepID=UPI0009C79918|nr:retron St85 family RNA-directed DNA polymerase [Clostridium beijerinckii]NRT80938.1 retron-type reverse transcriptase [Clostridium beijerinckii]OOM48268.1 reverse transcriptase [Clostridium beijerinckii]
MENHIEKFIDKLKVMQYSDDYINLCIEYAERLTDNNLPIIFDIEHFSFLVGLEKEYINYIIHKKKHFYIEFTIKKRKGGNRLLSIPSKKLKYIQRWILDEILYKIPVNEHAKGYIPNKSIVDNAKPHVKKKCIIKLDIKDFFDNIDYNRVFRIFYYYGYTKNMSYKLAELCTYENKLPQGAPTSPYISNIVCLKMDKRFSKLCNKFNATYTRYADDITISGDNSITKYFKAYVRIIESEGFEVNAEKVISIKGNRTKRVTGIVVNEKLSVGREMKRKLRQQIYYCKKYGVRDHLKKIECEKSFYKEHLYGIAYYIKSVEPIDGEKFLEELDEIMWEY